MQYLIFRYLAFQGNSQPGSALQVITITILVSGQVERACWAGCPEPAGRKWQAETVTCLLPGIALFYSLGSSGEKDAGSEGEDNIA